MPKTFEKGLNFTLRCCTISGGGCGMDILVTNNPLVEAQYSSRFKVVFLNTGLAGVLTHVRDCVHKGHKLLTHPLSGSVKPNETPYKSVLLSAAAGAAGTAGTAGAAGTAEIAGTAGTAGTAGAAGTTGAAGTAGTVGTAGSSGAQAETDFQSVCIIEECITAAQKFPQKQIPEEYLHDLQVVDLALIQSAL